MTERLSRARGKLNKSHKKMKWKYGVKIIKDEDRNKIIGEN